VEWGRLTHAYGYADDVPALIRALRSADAKERDDARYELYGNIYHQGTRFEASRYAVPFLLELLADPDTPDRADLLRLLAALAVGQDYWYFPDGFPIDEERALVAGTTREEYERLTGLMNAWLERMVSGAPRSPQPVTKDERRLLSARHALATYDAVAVGVPLIAGLLADADPRVVELAAYALAWFPEHADTTVPMLAAAAGDPARPESMRAHALIALGLAARPGTVGYDALLDGLVGAGEPELQWAAAVALAMLRVEATPASANAVLRTWAARDGDSGNNEVWGISRDTLALRLLDRSDPDAADDIRATAILTALKKPVDSNWHNHVNVPFSIAYPDGRPESTVAYLELTRPQRLLVDALIERPEAFTKSSGAQYNLRVHCLPETHEALVEYAAGSQPSA
jgi:hypothetical protein